MATLTAMITTTATNTMVLRGFAPTESCFPDPPVLGLVPVEPPASGFSALGGGVFIVSYSFEVKTVEVNRPVAATPSRDSRPKASVDAGVIPAA